VGGLANNVTQMHNPIAPLAPPLFSTLVLVVPLSRLFYDSEITQYWLNHAMTVAITTLKNQALTI
jgi:hypothetical protein